MQPLVLLVVLAGTAAIACAQTAVFRSLGGPQGTGYGSTATAVSADGTTIVGYVGTPQGNRAVRWVGLSGPSVLSGGGPHGVYAFAVSSDGGVIVGEAREVSSGWSVGFRWTEATGLSALQSLAPAPHAAAALGVSEDGSVVVGRAEDASGAMRPVRWTIAGVQAIVHPITGEAYGVSADGGTIVGHAGSYPFVYIGSQLTPIGPAGAGVAYAVTPDAQFVIGQHNWCGAFRWTPVSGFSCLGAPAGSGTFAHAYALSMDGSVIVGYSRTLAASAERAFIWDEQHGIRDLQTALENEHGLDLAGWTLRHAFGVSGDGRVIVGTGVNPCGQAEAWAVYRHGSAPCYANCDGSTNQPILNVDDFTCFINRFAAGDEYANCDGSCADPRLNVDDFTCFINQFAGGCP